jgi:hypothetical protein
LAGLYAEGNQRELAEEKIDAMRKIVAEHPDSARALEIEDLEKAVEVRRASIPRP